MCLCRRFNAFGVNAVQGLFGQFVRPSFKYDAAASHANDPLTEFHGVVDLVQVTDHSDAAFAACLAQATEYAA